MFRVACLHRKRRSVQRLEPAVDSLSVELRDLEARSDRKVRAQLRRRSDSERPRSLEVHLLSSSDTLTVLHLLSVDRFLGQSTTGTGLFGAQQKAPTTPFGSAFGASSAPFASTPFSFGGQQQSLGLTTSAGVHRTFFECTFVVVHFRFVLQAASDLLASALHPRRLFQLKAKCSVSERKKAYVHVELT